MRSGRPSCGKLPHRKPLSWRAGYSLHMTTPGVGFSQQGEKTDSRSRPVALSWLITVRWTTLAAGVGAVVAGRGALQMAVPVAAAATALSVWAGSNLWLMWRARRAGVGSLVTLAGLLVCADV